jgi:hypothetical protein
MQPIFSARLQVSGTTHNIMTLSDTGSTVGFCIKDICDRLNIKPAGQWCGLIEMIYATQEVTTNFYKLMFKLPNNQTKSVFYLGTVSLGQRPSLPLYLVEDICEVFSVDKSLIYKQAGKLEILIGQDYASLTSA